MKSISQHIYEINTGGKVELFRKLKNLFFFILKTVFNSFIYLFIFTLYFILLILSPFILIRFGEIETRLIGHCSLPIEIYLSEKELLYKKSNKITIDLFFRNKIVCNQFLYNKWKKHLNIIPNYFFCNFYFFLLKLNPKSLFLVPYRHWKTNDVLWQEVDIYNVLPITKPHLIFNKNEYEYLDNLLLNFGITNKDKIICFHVREPFFHGGPLAKFGPRDSPIALFEPAILYLANLGYKVIRVGRTVSSKVNIIHPNFFDYATSKIKSDILDIYLMFKAEFTIGTISGLESVTTMFRKPLCAINCVEWRGLDSYSFNQVPYFLPKKFFWKNSNIQLTLSEIISTNSYMFGSDEEFDNASIYYQDNSDQDILETVIEMTNWYEDKSNKIYPSPLQESFSNKLPDRHGKILESRMINYYLHNNINLIV